MDVTDDNNVEVELQWKEGLQIESEIRHFNPVLMDDRKKGKDSAPTPVEMFLASVGSCLIMSFVYCTYLAGAKLDTSNFRVKMVGDIERKNNRLRLVNVRAEFRLKSSKDDIKIKKCFEKFQPFCILSESIKSGISFSCDLSMI